MTPRTIFATTLVTLALAPSIARAQVGPGTTPGGGPAGPAGAEEEEKPEGVAESAPKTPGLLPTTPTLPPAKGKRNRFELFELDGYFRFRGDYMKNFNLSFRDDPLLGGAPFPRALGCTPAATDGSPGDVSDRPCDDTVKSANIRLRLEPTININETTSVHTQIDVLDNYVMGTAGFDPNQVVTQTETPSVGDAIEVKRAWAEVITPLGILKFGRQPEHWGMGIYYNSGGEDPINGGYDLDSEFGDTVDRVSFSTLIPGTKFRGAIAMDWPKIGPTSAQSDDDRGGQPFDLDDNDDVSRWVAVLSRMDAPSEFRDAVDRGELALNYGIHFAYATQAWTSTADPMGSAPNPDLFVPRDAKIYTPDVWLRLGWDQLLFELEAITAFGNLNRLDDLGITESVSLRQFGGVGRLSYRALEDKLKFGLELGGASGDQWDNTAQGETHISNAQFGVGDDVASRFVFDRDYKVDLILFRELIGAVTNAIYTKPFLSYELTKGITLRVANITSFAVKPVSTPGNGTMYGTEFDADIGYDAGAFHAGLAYGVLFPLSAMNHPQDDASSAGEDFGYGANAGDAGTAHTLQMRFGVAF